MDNEDKWCDKAYNIILTGTHEVGKSAIIKQFVEKSFTEQYVSTYGRDFNVTVEIDDIPVKLRIWDIADTPRWISLPTEGYFREADGILIVYNVTDKASFDSVTSTLEDLKKNAKPSVKIVLVGNVSDQVARKKVDYFTAKDLANANRIPLYEVSAKDGTNVEEAFMCLVTDILSADTAT